MGLGYLDGTFDLLNIADVDVIRQARSRCSELVVGVHSDQLILELTGRAPVVLLSERLTLVGHVRGVQAAVVHHEGRAVELGADRVFAHAGGTAVIPHADAWVEPLVPAVQSASPLLRAALRPAADGAVA